MANFLINILKKFQNNVTLTANNEFKSVTNETNSEESFPEDEYVKEIERLGEKLDSLKKLKSEMSQSLKEKVTDIVQNKIEKFKTTQTADSIEPMTILIKVNKTTNKKIHEEKLLKNYFQIQREKILEYKEVSNEIANSLAVRVMAFEEEFKKFLLDQQTLHDSLKDLSKSGLAISGDFFRKDFL
jgi:phage host-nuclease inhibitor protein Gam